MAEVLERVSELEEEQALDGGSAALALALDGARHDPHLRGDIAEFLTDQRRLIKAQLEHLHEQFSHLRLRHWGERLKLALQALTILVGLIALGTVLTLAWQAHRSNGVVIEAFSAPPDLAARGVTGQVLASQVEDRLNAMQSATLSARPAASYSNNWGHDIKVEIPETGVSVGELQRFLRSWLGAETHVAGEVFRTPAGLSMTVRVAEAGGDTVTGAETDLDALTLQAAEKVYARTQPFRYSQYLIGQNRMPEATAVLNGLAANATGDERAWALAGLANLQTDPHRSIAIANEALAIDPNLAIAQAALMSGHARLGDFQDAFKAEQTYLALLDRPDHGGLNNQYALIREATRGDVDTQLGDYQACRLAFAKVAAIADDPRRRDAALESEAFCVALDHEPSAAVHMRGAQDDVAATKAWMARGMGGFTETTRLALRDREDWQGVVDQIRAMEAFLRAQDPNRYEASIRARLYPGEVEALAWLHRFDEAKALVPLMPSECFWCMASRGQLAQQMGDYPLSDRLFGEAIRMTPSQPAGYEWLALAKLHRGDPAGAIAWAQKGLKVGPHFANLWEDWGEALQLQGDLRGAIDKFATAGQFAPRWGRLHLKWGEALARQGKRDEARAQFTAAAGMDLSTTDRAELAAQRI